ncbi:TIGR01777 family oxidoreductase [Sanguibacter suaedae]|uniref:TIGR01777 family oxidoreductase n=1 Tax=Sanguibacter suaedae TaxID=2795737 RepID=A0A934IAE4_9MICO|nr:TIGR01777 family oxidoreductase [Sanguibacter suaedae]MBI9114276.1 TIGR01777 family oxidoreductase [Sanguibacter suaedae]
MDTPRRSPRTILVAGSSGLIGTALVDSLRADGDTVRTLVRRPPRRSDEHRWDPALGHLDPDVLAGVDAVVNLAGAGVGDHRWTSSYRRTIRTSRTSTTGLLATAIRDHGGTIPLIQGTAIGYYGDRGDEVLTESSSQGDGFLAEVVADWERATAPASDAGSRVVLARTGIVLSGSGGALGRLLPLLRLGVGGRLGGGTQFWSWITLEDEVRALRHLVDVDVAGVVNLTAPSPARNSEITQALAHAFHRPAVVAVPGVALKVALGEFSTEILGSQRVLPTVLEKSGFEFSHATLDAAAGWVAGASG